MTSSICDLGSTGVPGDVKVTNSCDPLAKDDAALGEGTIRSLLDLAAETAGTHSRCRDMERVGPAMDEILLKRVCHLVVHVYMKRSFSLVKRFW